MSRASSTGGGETGTRGVSPVVGVVALIALTVCLGAVVAAGVGSWSIESGAPTAAFDLAADASTSTITIEYVAGDAIDVEALSVTVAVDGTDLASQPPVPFVGADGFDGAPSGPFNAKADRTWRSGTTAGIAVAETNSPEIERGDPVTVTLVVDDRRIATVETTAQ